MSTSRRAAADAPDAPLNEVVDDPGWITRLGGPTFIVVVLTIAVFALAGRGILADLDTAQLSVIVTIFVGGEKAAKAAGRIVSKRRY